MVLTRAQAQAARIAQAEGHHLEVVEGIVTEVEDEDRLAVTHIRAEAEQLRLETQVSRIVDNFWNETQRLAAQHTLLQSNQVEQANEYRAALVAIQDHAQSSTAELAAHQQWVEVQIQKALEDTRESLQQDLRVVANAQAIGSEAAHQFVQRELQQVREQTRQEALEVKQMIETQATKAQQIEEQMGAALSNAHDVLMEKINALIAEPAASNAAISSRLYQMKEDMQRQIDSKFEEIATSVVELCIAQIEERGSGGGKLTTRRVQKLISTSAAAQEARMEDKVKQLVQQANAQLHEEMETTHQNQLDYLREHLNQQVKDETAAAEVRMENRLREMLLRAQGDRTRESQTQKEAMRAVEAKLDRTTSSLTAEIRQMQCRLNALETKTPTSNVSLSTAAQPRHDNNDAVPAILRHMDILSRRHERDRHEHSDRLKQYLRAELSRAFHAPSAKAEKASSNVAGTRKSDKTPKTTPPPLRSAKLQRAIDQAQRDVKKRSEDAARRYVMRFESLNKPGTGDEVDGLSDKR